MNQTLSNHDNLIKTKNGLIAPRNYFDIAKIEKERVQNGCGPSGFIEKIVPEEILGVKIQKICNIHDFMYHHSKDQSDLKIADDTFLENLKFQIKKKGDQKLRPIRMGIAYIYYFAVRLYSSIKGPQTQ